MHEQTHGFFTLLLHFLAAGTLGLVASSLAMSFGSRFADRLPGESRRPLCLYCSRPLTWQEASPLIGWLLRPDTFSFPCPCGLRTGLWQQPFCELLGFSLGLLSVALQGWSWPLIPLCIGMGLLPAMALIDFHFGIIPDELNLLLGVCGAFFTILSGGDFFMGLIVASALLCLGLFFALVYSRWRGKEMLGLGDVKFFAAAGFWMHAHTAPTFLMLSGLLGFLFTLVWRRISHEKEFPFAPALSLSLALCVFARFVMAP
ncbi:MAG: A24 family peptidase [Alphaproteobacteria bacterium]|nr:A24 family peptidase [Alphaproteobacteria bacterium]